MNSVILGQKNLKDINPQGDPQGASVNSESNTTGDEEVEKSGSLPEKLKEDINAQVEHKGENVNIMLHQKNLKKTLILKETHKVH